jgi:hypothetical protein
MPQVDRSEKPWMSDAEWALRADRSLLIIALTQQWDPWHTPAGQPAYARRWRGNEGRPERVAPECLLLRVSPFAWMELLTDAKLPTWRDPAWPEMLFGIEMRLDSEAPDYSWRLMLRGDPETLRGEGTFGGDHSGC